MAWTAPWKQCSHLPYSQQTRHLATPPAYPGRKQLSQWPRQRIVAVRLATTLARSIAALQVYEEPYFTIMCDHFRAACETEQSADDALLLWMHECLPILCQVYDSSSTSAAACQMHTWAQGAILSAKTRERALQRCHEHQHVSVSQADAVFPQSAEKEAEYLRKLGITRTSFAQCYFSRPARLPDPHTSATPGVEDYGPFAVRVLLWPRMHRAALAEIIADASSTYKLDGARDLILAEERPWPTPPYHLNQEHMAAFRTACIRSPYYGRIYLWLLQHGKKYAAPTREKLSFFHADPMQGNAEQHQHRPVWAEVSQLQLCTGAAYAAFGAGPMPHWRQVLMHAYQSYLFETDQSALLALAELPIHRGQVHVVPCGWHKFDVGDLQQPTVVSSVTRNNGMLRCSRGVVHLLSVANQESSTLVDAGHHGHWYHYTTSQAAATTARHACRVYEKMGSA